MLWQLAVFGENLGLPSAFRRVPLFEQHLEAPVIAKIVAEFDKLPRKQPGLSQCHLVCAIVIDVATARVGEHTQACVLVLVAKLVQVLIVEFEGIQNELGKILETACRRHDDATPYALPK